MTLTELADLHRSDKGTKAGDPPHRYTYLYDLILHPLRHEPITLLELGLAVGGPELGGPAERTVDSPSVRMWLEYFSDATIVGFDISDFSHIRHPRFRFVRGDAGSLADLERLSREAPCFDVVIDDASHASFHQQLALRVLWERVRRGGLYVIEDLHWQPQEIERTLPAVPPTAAVLQRLFEQDQFDEQSGVLDRAFLDRLKAETKTFAAFSAYNGTASGTKQMVLRKA